MKIRRLIGLNLVLVAAVGFTAPQCVHGSSPPPPTIWNDASHMLGSAINQIPPLPNGTRRLPDLSIVIPPQVDDFIARTRQKMQEITAQHISNLDEETARRIVRDACTTKDWAEVFSPYWDEPWDPDKVSETARKVLINNGGDVTLKDRVAELTMDIKRAETSTDAVVNVASFGLCEWA
ncbi:hypothetical protein ABZ896_17135 [Streptomyces sp. NPDC047072]|uniref:hypothetical protein n=1 Tax=Streptomyces sp. NPDC047072 TaxID=3154809 RepID=UPI0033CB07EE